VRLETERLILREITESDWPDVLAYQNDPRYLRYYPWTQRTEGDVQAFVKMLVANQYEQPRTKFQFAITLKSDNHLIGNVGVRLRQPLSAGAHEADIGYELNPQFWRQGYATEAARAILKLGFTELGVHRISAECNAENSRSRHVLEKLGMRLEGRLREKEHYKGQWWDTLLFAILEGEWMAHENGSSRS
jgi:ribosomal-protein-alanine N-acetyltransferase